MVSEQKKAGSQVSGLQVAGNLTVLYLHKAWIFPGLQPILTNTRQAFFQPASGRPCVIGIEDAPIIIFMRKSLHAYR
jgi:hypothetical protein